MQQTTSDGELGKQKILRQLSPLFHTKYRGLQHHCWCELADKLAFRKSAKGLLWVLSDAKRRTSLKPQTDKVLLKHMDKMLRANVLGSILENLAGPARNTEPFVRQDSNTASQEQYCR